jgi:hypothetical protein
MSAMKLLIVLALISFSVSREEKCSATPTVHSCSTMVAPNCWKTEGTSPNFTASMYQACPVLANPSTPGATSLCRLSRTTGTGTCDENQGQQRRNTLNTKPCVFNGDCVSESCVLQVCTPAVTACGDQRACATGKYCAGVSRMSGVKGTCSDLLGLGVACTSTSGESCAGGHYCPLGENPVCTPFKAVGGVCTLGNECGPTMYCPETKKCAMYGSLGDTCTEGDKNFCNPQGRAPWYENFCHNGKCVEPHSQATGAKVSDRDLCVSGSGERTANRDYVCVQYKLDESSRDCPAGQDVCKYTYVDEMGATKMGQTQRCYCSMTGTPKSMCPEDQLSTNQVNAAAYKKRLGVEKRDNNGDAMGGPKNASDRLSNFLLNGQNAEASGLDCFHDVVAPLSAGRITLAILFVAGFIAMIVA